MAKQAKIPAVRFNLKTSSSKDEVLIYLVFRYNGQRLKYSTGEKVIPTVWDNARQRSKYSRKYPQYADLNTRLNKLENFVIEIFKENDFGRISIADFKNELDLKTGKVVLVEQIVPDFIPFVEQYLKKASERETAKRGTYKMYRTALNHLIAYQNYKRNQLNNQSYKLNYHCFNLEFRFDFEDWLYKVPRSLSNNYASKMLDLTRQFLKAAADAGHHTNLSFNGSKWKIQKEKVQKFYLDWDELEQIANLDLSDNLRLDKVRDLFLIGAYSGLRFSDFKRIKPENIIFGETEGEGYIQIWTKKTGREVNPPLIDELQKVLEKNNWQAPKCPTNQRFNEYIKEICEKAALTKTIIVKKSVGSKPVIGRQQKYKLISSHTARRSYLTNMYELGHTAKELMAISGQRYGTTVSKLYLYQ